MATRRRISETSAAKTDVAATYDEFKEFEGRKYTGMKIGRSHKWYYDRGEWKEKKITPDLWQITYAVTKRRAGRAPEGSGVPVGTGYHWYILAHQNVTKLNANDYTTSMTGLKFKVAHKRAGTDKWSATPKTQRKRMITFLRGVIADLERSADAPEDSSAAAAPAPKAGKAAKRSAALPRSIATPTRRRRALRRKSSAG
jgi:pyruvate/2-oxoglutarate dehydrogenase complex dihydrolipoamide acyltransferase (E2) component